MTQYATGWKSTNLDKSNNADNSENTMGINSQVAQEAPNLVGRTLAQVEKDLILDTLNHCLGNRTHAKDTRYFHGNLEINLNNIMMMVWKLRLLIVHFEPPK